MKEVGFGASYIPEVDELIAVDMGCIGEDLSCTEYDVSICAKDTSGPYNLDLTNNLIFLAKNAGVVICCRYILFTLLMFLLL